MARVSNIFWTVTDTVRDPFSVDTARLPVTGRTDEGELREGDAFDLSAAAVASTWRCLASRSSRTRQRRAPSSRLLTTTRVAPFGGTHWERFPVAGTLARGPIRAGAPVIVRRPRRMMRQPGRASASGAAAASRLR